MGRKRIVRTKESLTFVNNVRARSSVLSKRRKTLFKKSHTLHALTNADVLTIVQTKRERSFYGTGKLREQYLAGEIRSQKGKEVSFGQKENNIVLPLIDTPSPSKERSPNETGGSRRSLKSQFDTKSTEGRIPRRVLEVLTNKPGPVLLPSEIN